MFFDSLSLSGMIMLIKYWIDIYVVHQNSEILGKLFGKSVFSRNDLTVVLL